MYHIAIDKPREFVEVALGGMMPVDEVAEYHAELRRQLLAQRMNLYRLIVDVSEMPVQAHDTIHAMGHPITDMPKARAIAIVTGKSLSRMQIRRIFKQPYLRIVATIAEGRAWVFDGVEPSACSGLRKEQ